MRPRRATTSLLARRAVAIATFALLVGLPQVARAQDPAARYAGIVVDVGPLRAKGLGPYADVIGAALRRELAAAFADRVGGPGPRLIVRLDAISLRSYAGAGNPRSGFGGSAQSDYLEGEALVVGRRGEILSRLPQLSALPSNSGGAWYLPDAEERRLAALAQHFAGWLKRRMG